MPVLVLIGGPTVKRELVVALAGRCESVLCADGGGFNVAKACGITPLQVIGDGDSLSPSDKGNSRMTMDNDQDTTDLEKVFLYCTRHGVSDVWVAGGLAGDIDHVFGHLSLLAKFSDRLRISFYSDAQVLSVVKSSMQVTVRAGDIVSLLPLPKAEGITTSGLEYPLRDEQLELGVREGICNKSLGTTVTVHCRSGVLGMLYPHHLLS